MDAIRIGIVYRIGFNLLRFISDYKRAFLKDSFVDGNQRA